MQGNFIDKPLSIWFDIPFN